jgi:uncharacterized protein YcbX
MLRVSQLNIYPIKSLGGISLDRVRVTDRGLYLDRRWMLVDEGGIFMTQREFPKMALIRPALAGDRLLLTSALHSDPLHIPVPAPAQTAATNAPASSHEPTLTPAHGTLTVRVWDDICEAQYVDPAADVWLTAALGVTCRLVYMPDSSQRTVDPKYVPEGGITSFADGYPFLLIGQASLDELNGRLEQPIPMDRFRPNIVFTGGKPFEEDQLPPFSIGGIQFKAVKPCARCVMTTIDQQTAHKGKEPLKTLANYRTVGKKILFGQNLMHEGLGELAVGDELIPVSAHRYRSSDPR